MKRIIVPSDFSDNAKNALAFAKDLAARKQEMLTLYHAYHVPLPVSADPLPSATTSQFVQSESEIVNASNKMLEEVRASLDLGDIKSEIMTDQAAAVDGLTELSKLEDTDLIVMGTNGAHGAIEALFGSVTSHTIREAKCPVLAIPGTSSFAPFKNILVACDLNHDESASHKYVLEMAKLYGASVQFLHINNDEYKGVKEGNRAEEMLGGFRDEYENVSIHCIESDNIEEGIQQFIKENNNDMLAMTTHITTFFQRLFHRSITKRIALHTKIPLLAFSHHYPNIIVL